MVKALRRWNGRIVSLQIDQKTYHGGKVVVELVSNRQFMGTYRKTAERKYSYVLPSGKRIPIYHTGNNRVVEHDGRLVKLLNETKLD